MSIHDLSILAEKLSSADREKLVEIYRGNELVRRVASASYKANGTVQTRVEDILRLAENMGAKKSELRPAWVCSERAEH